MKSSLTKQKKSLKEKKAQQAQATEPPSGKIRFSNSKVQCWIHCHLQYKYSYIDRLAPKKKVDNLQIGDIAHKLLDLWNRGKLTSAHIKDLESFVQTLYPFNEGDESLLIAREAARLVVGYIRQYENDPLKIVSSEVHIQVELPNYFLYGRMDGLSRTEDERLWRLEYKTARKMDSYYLDGLKAGLQGAIYDYLIEENFKEKLSGTIYSMLIKTNVPQFPRAFAPINRPAIKRMHQTLDGVYRDILKGDFYPSSQCLSYGRPCDFKLLCDNDNEETRQAFYVVKAEEGKEIENETLS